jgi:hypothetical protein
MPWLGDVLKDNWAVVFIMGEILVIEICATPEEARAAEEAWYAYREEVRK